ncbi:MAG: toxic anion resistance protein [Solobacterium sp.]|nr:toxic anion resistance protein [Solobacterium sp.]MCH4048026.1 toxic anion resistance protein [Solobacterium sp.]MCH4075388.1 toxic anion resistance protein [Solobacterium sp.]MCI1313762.1 toxic anion resistance protein [Solobacterium sp.]MCI1407159.1 toxic anion resistance protein [Solobacterium sp.]
MSEERWKPVCDLSGKERQQAEDFAGQIDLSDLDQILHYGSACEDMMKEFADRHLLDLPSSAKGRVYEALEKLIGKVSEFNAQFEREPKDFQTVFRDACDRMVCTLNHSVSVLEMYKKEITRHMHLLQQAEALCLKTIRTYDLYILAGKICLQKETEPGGSGFIQENERENRRLEQDCMERRLASLAVSQKIPEQTIGSIHVIEKEENILYASVDAITSNAFPLYQNSIVLSVHTHREGEKIVHLDHAAFEEANRSLMQSLRKIMK